MVATICTQVNAQLIADAGDDGIPPEYTLRPDMEPVDNADLGTIGVLPTCVRIVTRGSARDRVEIYHCVLDAVGGGFLGHEPYYTQPGPPR